MIDIRKLEMEKLTRSDLDGLEHRIGYARAKLDQDAHNIVEDTVPKARLKKLVSAYKKTHGHRWFNINLPVTIKVKAGWDDDCMEIGFHCDWDGDLFDTGITDQLFNQLTTKKFLVACPKAQAYIKELKELDKFVKEEVVSICEDYHIDDDDVYNYVYEQQE